MLLLPPRHGKSELASKRYPAWLSAVTPAGNSFPYRQRRRSLLVLVAMFRIIVGSLEYRTLFDTRLAEDSQPRAMVYVSGRDLLRRRHWRSVLGRARILCWSMILFVRWKTRSRSHPQERLGMVHGHAYNRLMPNRTISSSTTACTRTTSQGDCWPNRLPVGTSGRWWSSPRYRRTNEALWPEAYPIDALHRIRQNTSQPGSSQPSTNSNRHLKKVITSKRSGCGLTTRRRRGNVEDLWRLGLCRDRRRG